jgi:hypothetical protein
MVLQVSYHLFVGILVLEIGLTRAFPTGSSSEPGLPKDEESQSSETQPTNWELTNIPQFDESQPTETPPTNWELNKLMENPNLYGGDMLGGLGFGNETFSVRTLAFYKACRLHLWYTT